MNLTPPSEHQVLVFFVGLALILVVARLLGGLMRRIGQPAVIGELTAGLLLGPSLLGRVAPDASEWLFPQDAAQTAMLFTVGWLGVMFLLVGTGYETDLGLIRRLGGAAVSVSTGSLLVPMFAGLAVGITIPAAFVGEGTERYVFALFVAAALSISSLPVIAKILSEMGLMRRDFGQLTLAAGMANDVIGWILLGVVAGLARGGLDVGQLTITLVGLLAFFVVAFTLGQRAVDMGLRRVRRRGDDPVSGLVVVVTTALVFGVVTQWLHVEAVLGAFVAGIVLARSRFAEHHLVAPLETVTVGFLAPVFFATAGLRVDLGLLGEAETLMWAIIVVVVASLSKFVGAWVGARLGGLASREGAALGVGLNARGALEIVIATVGLSLGVLTERSYTVVVLMAMATSMMAPPLLRAVLKNFVGNPAERARLDREAVLAANTVVTPRGVLIPTRGGVSSLLAAQVVALAWPPGTPVTLLTVGRHRLDIRPFEAVLAGKKVTHRVLDDTGALASTLVGEAVLGHGAMVVGANADDPDEAVISPMVDEVIARCTVPVVVVRMPRGQRDRLPWAFGRAVVPVNGVRSTAGGVEVAAHLSAELGTHLDLLYVDTDPARSAARYHPAWRGGRGREVLDQVSLRLTRLGANFSADIVRATTPAGAIIDAVGEVDADLVVMSGSHRGGAGAPVFGNTIERTLVSCAVTLVLVVTPDPAAVPRVDDVVAEVGSAQATPAD